jgi:hypothetical protein
VIQAQLGASSLIPRRPTVQICVIYVSRDQAMIIYVSRDQAMIIYVCRDQAMIIYVKLPFNHISSF